MQCFKCQATIIPGDLFCEECGAAIAPAAPASHETTPACQKCGATADQIDAEGYCATCGFRNPVAGDRLDIEVSPCLVGVSDRGLRHHQNEDFLALATVTTTQQPTHILVVCDGVSSSQHPEQAAQVAAAATCNALSTSTQASIAPEIAMTNAIASALEAVCGIPYVDRADADPPSTTIVAAIVNGNTATLGWLGDSRAYWISAKGARQLTQDDSWVNQAVASGTLTLAEACQSPHAHAITRWLGADAREDAKPSMLNFPIPGEGYLVLCSDGLWNYAPEPEQIQALMLAQTLEPLSLAQTLVEFARSQGGHDNITIALLQCNESTLS